MHTSTRTSSRFAGLAALATLTAALMGAAGTAHAGQGVFWAVNVDAPIQGAGRVGTTFSNTPHGLYGPQPVIVAPPVVYAPAPRVVYAPQPVYVQSEPVFVEGRRCPPRWGWRHHHDEGRYGWRDDRRDAYRNGYGDGRRDGRRDGRYAWGDDD